MLMEEESHEVPLGGNSSLQGLNTNEPLGYADNPANQPYPPAYSTLPSSGHTSIRISTTDENVNADVRSSSTRNSSGLQRSDTITSEVWYDASTVGR